MSKVCKIDLPITFIDGSVLGVVNATIVDIAPHVAHVGTFAIHRSLPNDRRWGKWTVTNVETGCRVDQSNVRDIAITRATEKLAAVTPRQLAAKMRKVPLL